MVAIHKCNDCHLLNGKKRYICTHDANGKSIYVPSPDQVYIPAPGVGGLAHSFAVSSIPANLTNDADINAYKSREGNSSHRSKEIVNSDGGANLLVIDLKPGASSSMHRTVSIDFSICVEGEIEHELDGGEKVRLFPGVRGCSEAFGVIYLNTNAIRWW